MSITSAAQYEFESQDASFAREQTASSLKREAAERLAAHRARRGRPAGAEESAEKPDTRAETRAARIAAAVAERYAHTQSYRAFLAAEAERAIEQAKASAEVAKRTAQAVAAVQQQLLTELEDWAPAPEAGNAPQTEATHPQEERPAAPPPALTVRLYEDMKRPRMEGVPNAVPYESPQEEERLALEEEIAFRQSASLDTYFEPATPLPANLIEFPRQLVAPRKARPRLAEGPLLEESGVTPETAQLRIFEVEPEQISTSPAAETTLPEWSSIRLDAHVVTEAEIAEQEGIVTLSGYQPLHVAPLGLRCMAACVDGCILTAAWLGFAAIFLYTAGHLPEIRLLAGGAIAVLFTLSVAYYLLFFTFSEATPGMRYARIGLCTFSDENPTRAAMRRRLWAILLAACPLGLGFLWAWLDDEQLGWHDRISRMYQRAY